MRNRQTFNVAADLASALGTSRCLTRSDQPLRIRQSGAERMMLTAEIADARIPGGRMVVVATHLEDKTKPEGRRKQLEELLEQIQSLEALDWIFVKPPSLTEPYDEEQPHRFAPHFGRTLKSLNDSMKDRISDHAQIMVDLPLAEPPLTKKREKRTIQTKN